MGFFASLYHSLFDVTWLAAVRTERKRGWKFFFAFSGLASVLIALVLTALLVPAIRSFERNSLVGLPDFNAEITSGTLRVTGITQPFIQRLPDGPFLFVLDTVSSSTPTIESLVANPTGEIVVINSKQIQVYSEQREERKNYDFSTLSEGTLGKKDLISLVDWLISPLGMIVIAGGMAISVFIVFSIGHLASLLLVSAVACAIARIAKRPWRYGELFTVGLFTPAVPLVISCIVLLLGIEISFLYSLSLLAFLLAIIFTIKIVPPTEQPVAEGTSIKM